MYETAPGGLERPGDRHRGIALRGDGVHERSGRSGRRDDGFQAEYPQVPVARRGEIVTPPRDRIGEQRRQGEQAAGADGQENGPLNPLLSPCREHRDPEGGPEQRGEGAEPRARDPVRRTRRQQEQQGKVDVLLPSLEVKLPGTGHGVCARGEQHRRHAQRQRPRRPPGDREQCQPGEGEVRPLLPAVGEPRKQAVNPDGRRRRRESSEPRPRIIPGVEQRLGIGRRPLEDVRVEATLGLARRDDPVPEIDRAGAGHEPGRSHNAQHDQRQPDDADSRDETASGESCRWRC